MRKNNTLDRVERIYHRMSFLSGSSKILLIPHVEPVCFMVLRPIFGIYYIVVIIHAVSWGIALSLR